MTLPTAIASPTPPVAQESIHRSLSPATRGWLLGALGVLAFAFTISMTRMAGGDASAPQLPPVFVAVGRAAAAGLLALSWLLAIGAPRPRPAQWRVLGLAGIGVVFGFPLCIGLAVRHVDAAHAAVVTGVLPIATAAMGAWWLRQRASLGFWLCAALGTALVLGFAAWKGGSSLQPADALLIGAVLFGGFGYVQCARLFTGKESALGAPMAPAHVISWVLVLALPLTLPLSALLVASSWPAQAIRPAAWLGFAYVSVISMWLGFFPWYRGLALGGTLRVSQVQLVQPFLSMWLAVPLLGESLDLPTVGFSLAVMATVIVSKRSAAPRG